MPAGTLWIHVNRDHHSVGHCWIEFRAQGSNQKTSWGTFGSEISDSERNNGARQIRGSVFEDRERSVNLEPTAGASREAIIDINAYNRVQAVITDYSNRKFAWTPWNTCAGFASAVWNAATGENLFTSVFPSSAANALDQLNAPATRDRSGGGAGDDIFTATRGRR